MPQLDLFSASSTPPKPEKPGTNKINEPKVEETNAKESKQEKPLTEPVSPQQSFLRKEEKSAAIESTELTVAAPNVTIVFDEEDASAEVEPANNPMPNEETITPIVSVEPATDEPPLEPVRIKKKRGRISMKDMDALADLVEIPPDEILFQKQYYLISEVAGWFKVNTSLLRFWETEFDVLKPRKNRKGDRMFRPEDVKNLVLIHHLLRERKYTIEGAKDYIKAHKKKADVQLQVTQSLQKFKSFLLELKANLQ